MRADVLEAFSRTPRELPCKYFYDTRGSQLFDRICELDEYYLTRTELAILRRHGREMGERIGPDSLLIEYGSGSSLKTRLLLEQIPTPAAYVPVDISFEHLEASAKRLASRFPRLDVLPLCADFSKPLAVPAPRRPARRRVAYFPGSTIGNFVRDDARDFLTRVAATVGSGGALLIGVDLDKDARTLERAYDDGQGITAAFNLNLLEHLNREIGSDFDLERFRHRAFYDPDHRRIEIQLVSLANQVVRIGDREFELADQETIRTEYSHKYRLADFEQLAAEAGFQVSQVWQDAESLFSVQLLERAVDA